MQFSPSIVKSLDALSEQQVLRVFFLPLDELVGEVEHFGMVFLVGVYVLLDSLVVRQKLLRFGQVTGNIFGGDGNLKGEENQGVRKKRWVSMAMNDIDDNADGSLSERAVRDKKRTFDFDVELSIKIDEEMTVVKMMQRMTRTRLY